MMNTSESNKSVLSRAALVLLFLSSANLYAEQPMSITLNGAAEAPPVTTSATGNGEITVLPNRTVSGNIRVTGLVPTMAHIHEGAAEENGPAIITLTRTGNDSFALPVDAKLTDAQYTSFMAGKLYVNVHSARYPDGEIRAQLLGKPITIAN